MVYQYPKFSNAAFGDGNELVWATVNLSQNIYAVKSDNGTVKIFKNFSEHKSFKTNFQTDCLFGGRLLGLKSKDFLAFYDWDSFDLVRRIDISPKHCYWSESGTSVVLAGEDTFYMLGFNQEAVKGEASEDGYEDAFQMHEEYTETVNSALWVSNECFVFGNNKGIISYVIGGKVLKMGNAERKYFLLGYDSKQNRLYMIDKALNIVSFSLLLSVVNFQAAILSEDAHGASSFLASIPAAYHSKLAKFLEANNQREMAFEITPDKDHKFDLAIGLNKIGEAYEIAEEQTNVDKWKKVGDLALLAGEFELAEKCFTKASDYNSLLLFYSSYGDVSGLSSLITEATQSGKYNVAFQAAYLLGDPDKCLQILTKSKKMAEAAFFARGYVPSKVKDVLGKWEDVLREGGMGF